jgi:hypothetical protein
MRLKHTKGLFVPRIIQPSQFYIKFDKFPAKLFFQLPETKQARTRFRDSKIHTELDNFLVVANERSLGARIG